MKLGKVHRLQIGNILAIAKDSAVHMQTNIYPQTQQIPGDVFMQCYIEP